MYNVVKTFKHKISNTAENKLSVHYKLLLTHQYYEL